MACPHIHNGRTRRTRIVCISDTHSASPADGAFKLPPGDVLIHAGDLTNQGSYSELKKTIDWINRADFAVKIVVAGNHDASLDPNFPGQDARTHAKSMALLQDTSITYLDHSSARISLSDPDGLLHSTFSVFGSPFVPARGDGWAFGYSPESDHAAVLWNAIPLDTDIVVTHTPAYNHCDSSPKWGAAGCKELRKALWRVRPRVAVCGHVHEGRGAERVRWKLDLPYVPFAEQGTEAWADPGMGSRKMSLLDLTGRKGGMVLENDGARARRGWENWVSFGGERMSRLHSCNTQSLSGRMGRKETCVVNAAIMARSYGDGPKRFNKPIVIDIDLPLRGVDEGEEKHRTALGVHTPPTSSRRTRSVPPHRRGAHRSSYQAAAAQSRLSEDPASSERIRNRASSGQPFYSYPSDIDADTSGRSTSTSEGDESIYNVHFAPPANRRRLTA